MRVTDFDYDLPGELIAQHPLPRGSSRLMIIDHQGADRHRRIGDLPELLTAGDLLVVNNTKVLHARLEAHRTDTGGKLEVFLLEEETPDRWQTLVRPARRTRADQIYELTPDLSMRIVEVRPGGRALVEFGQPILPHLDRIGHVPLPPYIRRSDEKSDRARYQTVYASRPGAVAAPTAGLHFSTALLDRIQAAGIGVAELTLHVGVGTFKPVTVERTEDHEMEVERYEIPPQTARAIEETRRAGGSVVAVGTTVVRALESAADPTQSRAADSQGETSLFITPGFKFRVVDRLLTNFHLPRSTLLMLVCAFGGTDRVLRAYSDAIAHGYRFYSYGDAMLVDRL